MNTTPHAGSVDGDAPAMEVHQAAGMLMVQLDTSIDVADAVLRSYALEVRRPLVEVARDVLAHRLRLHPPPTA